MVIVLFEVNVKKGETENYSERSKSLAGELSKAEGFISSESFSSRKHEGKLLSMSVWESEEAVTKWRNTMNHRLSQKAGRDSMFENYKITVASSLRVYENDMREEAPCDSNEYFKA